MPTSTRAAYYATGGRDLTVRISATRQGAREVSDHSGHSGALGVLLSPLCMPWIGLRWAGCSSSRAGAGLALPSPLCALAPGPASILCSSAACTRRPAGGKGQLLVAVNSGAGKEKRVVLVSGACIMVWYLPTHACLMPDTCPARAASPTSSDPLVPPCRAAILPGKEGWQYRDPEGNLHGPFKPSQMLKWLNSGYFDGGLQVCWGRGGGPSWAGAACITCQSTLTAAYLPTPCATLC